MLRRLTWVLLLAVYCLVPAIVYAENVFQLIPGDTVGYVVINRLAETNKKIQTLGQRMKLPTPSFMSMLKTQSGITQGLDETGSVCLAFFPTSQGPAAILFVPVDDYAAFIEQLAPEKNENNVTTGSFMGRQVIFGEKSGHAAIAWAVDRTLLQKVLSDKGDGQGMSDIVKTSNGSDHDVAAVLSSGGVKLLAEFGQNGLEQLKTALRRQSEDESMLMGIEFYVQLLSAVNSEVAAAAAGLQLDDQGSLRVNQWVWVQPAGKVAPILRDLEPPQHDLLAGLPNIPYVVALGGVLPTGTLETMIDFSRKMMKSMPKIYGLTPEQTDKMMDLSVKYFPDLRSMSFLLGVGREGGPLYSEMVGTMQVKDAKTYVTKYRQYWEELDGVIGEAEGSFLKDVKVEDVEMDDVSALKVTMPIPLQGLELPNRAEFDDLMQKFYGADGITMYFAAADDETVVMAYTEMSILRKAMEATTNRAIRISQKPNIVSTSKYLPSGAHMVGFWSPSGTFEFANRMMQLMAGTEKVTRLPAFPDTPPVGMAMSATPSVVTFTTVVPKEAVEAVGSFIEDVKQLEGASPTSE